MGCRAENDEQVSVDLSMSSRAMTAPSWNEAPMPDTSRNETPMPPDVPENAETDVAWREVARRTRMIAAQWKRLYIAEQSAAAEAKAAALQQKELRKKVEQDLNIALRQSEAAAQSLKAAVFEKKQWQDRSTAQQFSATYLELDATRTRLYETEASLKSTIDPSLAG